MLLRALIEIPAVIDARTKRSGISARSVVLTPPLNAAGVDHTILIYPDICIHDPNQWINRTITNKTAAKKRKNPSEMTGS